MLNRSKTVELENQTQLNPNSALDCWICKHLVDSPSKKKPSLTDIQSPRYLREQSGMLQTVNKIRPCSQAGAETSDTQRSRGGFSSRRPCPACGTGRRGKHRRETSLPDWKLPGYLKGGISHPDFFQSWLGIIYMRNRAGEGEEGVPGLRKSLWEMIRHEAAWQAGELQIVGQ